MRKNLSKRTRFEVFKRDGFTCQYCGAQPPDAVLVIDHIHPVAKGGTDDETNLTTACEGCNQGKSDVPLSRVPIRPDADLKYLETQQELVELRRFHESRAELEETRKAVCEYLQDYWCHISGLTWHPADSVILRMVAEFNPEDVEKAIVATAGRVVDKKVNKYDFVPYMYGVLHNLRRDRNG